MPAWRVFMDQALSRRGPDTDHEVTANLRIDLDRLLGRLDALAGIGAIEGGGVCRLALSDEDKAGRDLVLLAKATESGGR